MVVSVTSGADEHRAALLSDDELRRVLRERRLDARTRVRPAVVRLASLIIAYTTVAGVAMAVRARWPGRWSALVWLPAWAMMAGLLVSTGAVMHEAAHHHLTGRGGLDAVAGHLAGAFVFVPFAMYRPYHLAHHVDTCGPADSEGEPYAFAGPAGYLAAVVLGGWLFAAALTRAMVSTCAGRPPAFVRTAAQRRAAADGALVWFAGAVAMAAALVTVPRLALACWVAPVALVLSGPLSLLLIPEHAGAHGPGPKVANTRTCRSNRLVRWAFLNANFHTVHHVAPMIPWYELPHAHAAVREAIAGGWEVRGYLVAHRAIWRAIGTKPSPDPGEAMGSG